MKHQEYTRKERAVIAAVKGNGKKRAVVSLAHIVRSIYKGSWRPKNADKATAATIRTLRLKMMCNRDGDIVRISDLGAGNKGRYKYVTEAAREE